MAKDFVSICDDQSRAGPRGEESRLKNREKCQAAGPSKIWVTVIELIVSVAVSIA